ncbi:methyltransferase domain-containing protein [Streptomyces sp. NP-1717]|uniref:methyltransferase domain-containing protein n=1 Tax=unclassified Streptomyces TaxID=2593676 RepID=UPI001F5D8C1F|nr:methyltransferase domain-containing protein [Streptomyces sp. NP-1717]MCI3221146.1 methyltransferase domain-containing protein [Streptomyces sp. NP-1717]WTA72226.1 methyltransferase domain-containing protein [Streptomyces sp. NBC_00838]
MAAEMSGVDDVASFYEGLGQVLNAAWGENLHYGYWEDDSDDSAVEVATARLTDLLVTLLDPAPGAAVLDIGCGVGKPALQLVATRDVHVTGIAISDVEVEQAAERAKEAGRSDVTTFRNADVMELPFADGSFDGAWAVESLLHVPDRGRALAETARVLRPGGRLVIADTAEIPPLGPDGRAVLDDICASYGVSSFATAAEYLELLTAHGFVDVEVRDISDNVVRTGAIMADVVEARRDELAKIDGPEPVDQYIGLMRRAAANPNIGYLVVAATLGPASGS